MTWPELLLAGVRGRAEIGAEFTPTKCRLLMVWYNGWAVANKASAFPFHYRGSKAFASRFLVYDAKRKSTQP